MRLSFSKVSKNQRRLYNLPLEVTGSGPTTSEQYSTWQSYDNVFEEEALGVNALLTLIDLCLVYDAVDDDDEDRSYDEADRIPKQEVRASAFEAERAVDLDEEFLTAPVKAKVVQCHAQIGDELIGSAGVQSRVLTCGRAARSGGGRVMTGQEEQRNEKDREELEDDVVDHEGLRLDRRVGGQEDRSDRESGAGLYNDHLPWLSRGKRMDDSRLQLAITSCCVGRNVDHRGSRTDHHQLTESGDQDDLADRKTRVTTVLDGFSEHEGDQWHDHRRQNENGRLSLADLQCILKEGDED